MASDKPNMTVALLGHVDTGKSTLLGHLRFLCGCHSQREMDKMERESAEMGKASFKFAWLCDKTKGERERGITVTTTDVQLLTTKYAFTLVDTPGHRDFMKSTIQGASYADCAILVVSAPQSEFEASMADYGQTKELALIAFALGTKQLIVAVNKMDTAEVAYAEDRFQAIKNEMGAYLAKLGFLEENVQYVPVSGWDGDNLVTRSSRMSWYTGPPLLEALDQLSVPRRCSDKPLRVPVQAVYKIGGVGTVVVGRVETGVLRPGMKVSVGPNGVEGTAFTVEAHHTALKEAHAGTCVGINVKGLTVSDIGRGFVLSDPTHDAARKATEFTAQIVLLELPGVVVTTGFSPIVYCHTLQVACKIKEITAKLDRQTGEVLEKNPASIVAGDACIVVMEPVKAAVFESFREYPSLGRIIIRESGRTIGVGVIRSVKKSGVEPN